MAKPVGMQKLSYTIVVHSKPPIENMGILCLEFGLLNVEIRLI